MFLTDSLDARSLEQIVAGEKIGARQIQRRRNQPPDVDLRIRTEHDPIAVEEDHRSVGMQRPENLAGILIEDSIERNRLDIRLNELRHFVRRDIELLPVDDGLLRGLRDRHVRGAEARHRRVASHHDWPGRIGQDDWHDYQLREICEQNQTGGNLFVSHVILIPFIIAIHLR